MHQLWHSLEMTGFLGQGRAWMLFPLAQLVEEPTTDPVAVFLIILAIMLIAPLLVERLRLPGIIGLILAGVIVGPQGLGVLERDSTPNPTRYGGAVVFNVFGRAGNQSG